MIEIRTRTKTEIGTKKDGAKINLTAMVKKTATGTKIKTEIGTKIAREVKRNQAGIKKLTKSLKRDLMINPRHAVTVKKK